MNRFIRGFLRCVSGGFQRVSMMGNSLSVISQTTEIVNDFESRFAFLFFICVCVGSIRNSPTVYKYCILFPNLDEEPIRIDLASRRRTLPLLLVKMFRFFSFSRKNLAFKKKLKRKKEEKYCERSFTAPGGSHPSPLPY